MEQRIKGEEWDGVTFTGEKKKQDTGKEIHRKEKWGRRIRVEIKNRVRSKNTKKGRMGQKRKNGKKEQSKK